MALVVAVAESVRDYEAAVEANRVECPAHRRKSSSVEAIWTDVRLEAMRAVFGFGQADLMMLADIRQQRRLLDSFVNERPHLRFPQPTGESIADTWQGVWQIYRYLDAVGSEVMDPETDRSSLRSHGGDILKAFTDRALKLHDEWSAFERAIFGDGSLPGDACDDHRCFVGGHNIQNKVHSSFDDFWTSPRVWYGPPDRPRGKTGNRCRCGND